MTTLPEVVITDWGFPSLEPENKVFAAHDIKVTALQCKSEDEVAEAVRDADVVLTQWAPVKERAISAMTRCRGIVRYGIGLDNVDLAAAAARGIPVRNIPDYCLNEVADHTMALMLTLQRQVCRVQDLVREGTWKIVPPLPLPPLRESVLGVVGFGRIARLVAQRAKAFGVRVIAVDAFVAPEVYKEHDVEQVDLNGLFASADIVSLHCPFTDDTRHLINAGTLGKMKPLSLLINTSRGGLVDTAALVEALRDNRIAGAALDVLEQEPPAPDAEILRLPNAIVNSHISWYSGASMTELQRLAAEAVVELLKGTGHK